MSVDQFQEAVEMSVVFQGKVIVEQEKEGSGSGIDHVVSTDEESTVVGKIMDEHVLADVLRRSLVRRHESEEGRSFD